MKSGTMAQSSALQTEASKLLVTPFLDSAIQLLGLPKEWTNIRTVSVEEFEAIPEAELPEEIYTCADVGYNAVSNRLNTVDKGFCAKLANLCYDKYEARSQLKSLQSVGFKKFPGGATVEWPDDPELKLIAKPLEGTASAGVHVVRHGSKLPEGHGWIVERYIPDDVPRVGVDGWICGDEIGILVMYDNNYYKDSPTTFHTLSYPSKNEKDTRIREKYIEVVRELKEITGCNNQIIDVEFFVDGDEILVQEINPRTTVPWFPIYEQTCGFNPWLVEQSLKQGRPPVKTDKQTPRYGICRYNYHQHDKSHITYYTPYMWSTLTRHWSYTFAVSAVKDVAALTKEVEEVTAANGLDPEAYRDWGEFGPSGRPLKKQKLIVPPYAK